MAAVMASDSQILALSTMFTEDVFAFYGGKTRFGEHVQVQTGRLFVVILTLIAYAVAMRAPQGIFDLPSSTPSPATRRCPSLLLRRALLEAKHEMGSACRHVVGGGRGDLHCDDSRRARVVRSDAGRADDAHRSRADDRRVAADEVARTGYPGALQHVATGEQIQRCKFVGQCVSTYTRTLMPTA